MSNLILKGNFVAQEWIKTTKQLIQLLPKKIKIYILQIGNNAASSTYIKNKKRILQELNIQIEHLLLPNTITISELISSIKKLNSLTICNGILLQWPLPKHLDPILLSEIIDPIKDVDGFHPKYIQKLWQKHDRSKHDYLAPCTAKGIMYLFDYFGIKLSGQNVTLINRSKIVGEPLIPLLLQQNATLTICHSWTKNLTDHTNKSNVIITGIGKPGFLTASMVNKQSIVIDVGISWDIKNKISGDLDFTAQKIVAAYTPVPGGVGPMTIAALVHNLYLLSKQQFGIE